MNHDLPYSSITIPLVLVECVGSEPSLHDLHDFITKTDIKYEYDRTVIDEYMKSTTSTYTEGKYYLFGQVLTSPGTKLTTVRLENAINVNQKKGLEYGGPATGMEYSSIIQSERLFKDLLHIIELYYVAILEIEYKPVKVNKGYLRCLDHFTRSK